MPKRRIKLGDEIEDITSKTIGIATGRCEYLSGAVYWIVQPYTTDHNATIKEVYIPEAYCIYKGAGVYPDPKPPVGFHAGEHGDGKKH